jgi:hypothetical protein
MSYLQTYTVGSIIRNSWSIYFHNWLTLLLISVIPQAAVLIVDALIKTAGEPETLVVVIIVVLQLLASMFVSFPATVAVSEICLGIKPSVGRAYRRAFAQPGRLVGTYLLAFGIIALGFVALYIPGIVFSLWYMFIGPVVVLESLAGRAALKRSRELGKGYYLRNLGIFWVNLLLVLLLAMVLGGILGLLAFLVGPGSEVVKFIAGLGGLIVTPPGVIAVVLLYYDMRVRKDGYGAAQLAEDLRF